ncbi:STAS domain-containing protein [Parvibium lacunae]|uniref:STAS domain-containing protein n=1 Tax=Parvibium lacunae TaxID=1888893 RepID=A0A368KYL0_9BURK|nr:STAS domain-containing protein [Parvibium lacunae]
MPGFHPRLFDSLRGYNRSRLLQDVSAGLTVGVVALPLAMAFAIASGVKPENGIFTAIIAGFLISALGGSKVQIGGPAGAFIVIIYGIIERYGLANLLICTIMAGVLLFAMGLFKLGNLIRFIPVPIVIGFTNGIAVLIALSQIKDFFGLPINTMPADFFAKLRVLAEHGLAADLPTLSIGLASLLLVIVWPKSYRPQDANYKRWLTKVPGTIVALVLATLFVASSGLEVETIGQRFGGIPQALPSFALPHFSWGLVKQLVAPTLTIALLCAIESLLCARVADNLINASHKDRHDPNQELMAQGVANFIAPFFGGIPATGTIARTVTNVRSGATSPIAGIVHALTLLLIILLAAPLAYDVPLATLAAILLYVAWNMGEWREFVRLRKFSLPYGTVLVSTFLLTVIFDLTVAVEVGLVLASLFFIYRVSNLTTIERVTLSESDANAVSQDMVAVYRVYGSLFFGAVTKLENLFAPHSTLPKVVILDLHQTISIDTTGLEALAGLHHQLHAQGAHLVLCGLNKQPGSIIRRGGLVQEIGPDHVCVTLEEAYGLAHTLVDRGRP